MKTRCIHRSSQRPSNFSFRIIALIHDNPLLPLLVDAHKTLTQIGLKPGLKVLEVGCGPGFFTIPAARIVGPKGMVYAVDVQPLAIERIKKKIARHKITNVRPMLTNAAQTGLEDQSVDLAFIFNLPFIVGGRDSLLAEMQRILKPDGCLIYKKPANASVRGLIEALKNAGFNYSDSRKRNLLFNK